MKLIKILLLSLAGVAVIIFIPLFVVYATPPVYGCTPDFWKNNLDLWAGVGVDYNDDFDETFHTDYFEPDITLKQAINSEGLGWNRLASYGTAAYLDAHVNPYADIEIIREHVHDNSIHALDIFLYLCEKNTGELNE